MSIAAEDDGVFCMFYIFYIFFIILFNHYLYFCAENIFPAGYRHSDDGDQDDQSGDSGPPQAPGVPHVLLTTSCVCAQLQVPAGLQFDVYDLEAIHPPCFMLFKKLINHYQEDPLLSTVNVQEKV